MLSYKVDRSRLEAQSTEEILRILREERDDYTPEALEIFEQILAARGMNHSVETDRGNGQRYRKPMATVHSQEVEELLIRDPSDAVRVLNDLLKGVLDGSIEPQVAETATNLVMGILRAMEQEFMTEAREEP